MPNDIGNGPNPWNRTFIAKKCAHESTRVYIAAIYLADSHWIP